MSYDVRIIFDGLVAVGPPHSSSPSPDQPGPLFAVMPFANRTRSRKSLSDSENPTYTSVHFPVIITDLVPLGRKPDEVYSSPPAIAAKKYLWYPMRERMELFFNHEEFAGELRYERSFAQHKYPTQQPDEFECKAEHPEPPPRQSVVTLGNIDAVSDMREIWPRRSRLKRKMLRKKPPHEVAAQVFVPRGKVSGGTEDYHYPHGQCLTYEPKQTPYTVQKCAMQQIVVTVDNVTQIDIAMHSLDSGEELDPLSFKVDRPADIRLINADPAAIRAVLSELPIEQSRRRGADIDFENHYKLLRGTSGLHLPVPHQNPRIEFMLRPCYTTLVNGNG